MGAFSEGRGCRALAGRRRTGVASMSGLCCGGAGEARRWKHVGIGPGACFALL
eukprot:GDKH01001197.1.p6 GENE.GDKH01001197.1~~GDKH01001197.1.p6  ORF type:complete len:53 (-),score=6.18 GDKH01001197.1:128-286(-)